MTVGKFNREDLTHALLNYFVLDVVQCVQLIAKVHGIKRIFFCGSFASTPLVRRMITTEYVRRNLLLLGMAAVIRFIIFVSFAVDLF